MNDSNVTDENLVLEIGKGASAPLAELVRRHQQRTLQLAYRNLGDWQWAEDVAQEAFLRVHRAAPRYKPEAKFSTWFYRIIVNLCMDQLRKHQRQTVLTSDIPSHSSITQNNPAQHQEIQELRQAVKQAIGRLKERERLAVVLHRFEGQTHGQIAEIMETSVSAVESLLVRTYRKLRKELAPFSESQRKKTPEVAQPDV